jgi:hypothetical protein
MSWVSLYDFFFWPMVLLFCRGWLCGITFAVTYIFNFLPNLYGLLLFLLDLVMGITLSVCPVNF